MCAKDGAFAACVCPPGAPAKGASNGPCVLEAVSSSIACVVPDATIGRDLGLLLELGALEMPPLPSLETAAARDALLAVEGKEGAANDVDVLRLADAHETMEGVAAHAASSLMGPKLASKRAARDASLSRNIAVRRTFLVRFPSHAKADEQRLSLARALLRRAAYAGLAKTAEGDRAEARTLLTGIVTSGKWVRPARDAAFVLGEHAARDRDWAAVTTYAEKVLAWASSKTLSDDHALIAVAQVRIAHARLSSGDLVRARESLEDAITSGLLCAPRAECVTAASSARRVLAQTWAATSTPARTMTRVLAKGALPRHERVRPLLQLVQLYSASGVGTACAAAAEEARAWEQTIP